MVHNFGAVLMRSPLQSLADAYKFPDNLSTLFQEGVYLSSPEFWAEFQKKGTLRGKEREKLRLSLSKYQIRSCARCTPYATFAGSALVNISENDTMIVTGHPDNHTRNIRIDMNYLTEIIYKIMDLPHVREQVKLFTNNSLYELSDNYRYVQYSIKNNTRDYELTSVEKTDYIKDILTLCQGGATVKTLTDFLTSSKSVTEDEASDFINSMCSSQLLVSGLEPCVTGKEPLDNLVEQLELLNGTAALVAQLKNVQNLTKKAKQGIECYVDIENELKQLNIDVAIPKNTVQADLFLATTQNCISQNTVQSIVSQFEELLTFSRKNSNKYLDDFKKRFLARYENEEIPLALALDVESGIGYAGNDQSATGNNALINDLIIGAANTSFNSNFDPIQQFILSKYHGYLQHKKELIEVTEDEVKKIFDTPVKHNFPGSFYLFGELLKNETAPNGFTFDLAGCAGPSAGNLLARFTHGDAALADLTRAILKEEENTHPGAIFAEFAHLPQARIGNVLLRPVLRKYEIPYVGKSGIELENQIPVNDLMVSIHDNEITLRSIKHNKKIIPRLTTAHNYSIKALPVYKFLGDLQYQNLSQTPLWDWGILSSSYHLPRVVYKNLVIKKACWKVDESKIKDLPKDKAEWPEYFDRFLKKLQIPKRVLYVENDNKLLIDFEQPMGIELFLHYLKRYKTINLEEFLFTDENCIVIDNEGRPHTNELIIPLYRESQLKENPAPKTMPEQQVTRRFTPGSEWLYFKIFCGPTVAEKILKNVILPFVESGLQQESFKKFFFIRYKEESAQIRIRFYNDDISKQANLQEGLSKLLQPYLDNGSIEKVVLDTYVRELERYGADLIEGSESLFFGDSLGVLRFISLLDGGEFEKYRTLFAMRGIDMFLDDFNYSVTDKKNLVKFLQKAYFMEFGGANALEKQLNDKYRKEQKDIFSHMNKELDVLNEIEEGVSIFEQRSVMNRPVIQKILEKTGFDKLRIDELLQSYLHLFMNRLFVNNQRKYELVIYHFLERYYSSQLAIQNKNIENKKQ